MPLRNQKQKSPGDISDKRKQMLRKRVYSRALEQDVGGTLDSVCRVSPSAVARQKRRRIDWSLPRQLCDRSLKLLGFNSSTKARFIHLLINQQRRAPD